MSKIAERLYLSLIYLFLYLPIVILILYSFNSSRYTVRWSGFTLDWYFKIIENVSLMQAAKNSLYIAVLSASIASLIGAIAGFGIYNYRFKGRVFFRSLIYILIISPDIIMGISLLMLFNVTQIKLGFWSVLISHITFSLPFVIITVFSRLKTINKYIIDAARDLGASELRIFINIAFPLMLPSLISAWFLAFTLSLDDVVISFFVTGPDFQMLPIALFSLARLGIDPKINALCSLMFAFSLSFAFISTFLLSKKSDR